MANTDVRISPKQAIVLRAMLDDPKKPQYTHGLAVALDMPGPTVRHCLRRLETAGWLVSGREPRTGKHEARNFYNFTPFGLKAAKAEIATWEFTDE